MTHDRPGVRFPRTGADRSSSATAPQVLADSVAMVDPYLADRLRPGTGWRQQYIDGFASSTRLAVTPKASLSIAEEGIRSLRSRLVLVDGAVETPVQEWVDCAPHERGKSVGSATVHGSGRRVQELTVPYRGRRLRGAALEEQLHHWVVRGVVEPGFADAIRLVIANPSWLSMPGHRVVLLSRVKELAGFRLIEKSGWWGRPGPDAPLGAGSRPAPGAA